MEVGDLLNECPIDDYSLESFGGNIPNVGETIIPELVVDDDNKPCVFGAWSVYEVVERIFLPSHLYASMVILKVKVKDASKAQKEAMRPVRKSILDAQSPVAAS
jgi:hypothetical protein